MAVATWEDVAIALGRPTSSFNQEQQAQITYWLNGVELIIRGRFGDLSSLDQELLKYVETEAVAAKVPPTGAAGGESSVTVAVDDANVTRRWERPVSSSDITSEWWELLSPRRESSAHSTRPKFQPDCVTATPSTRVELW